MKLSDIKGEKALDILADVMELAEAMSDDDRVRAMMGDMRECLEKGAEDQEGDAPSMAHVVLRHVPAILKDKRYKARIISIMAVASEIPYEEYVKSGPVIADLLELLTSDAETLGFLIGSSAREG